MWPRAIALRIASVVGVSSQAPQSTIRPRLARGWTCFTYESKSAPVSPSIHWLASTSATSSSAARISPSCSRARAGDFSHMTL